MRRLGVALAGALSLALALPVAAGAAPSVTEFSSGFTAAASIHGVVAGPDGNIWVTDNANGKVDRVTPAGVVTVFNGPSGGGAPAGITVGPDNALWFVTSSSSQVGRMTTAGTLTNTYSMTGTGPQSIVTGPDGALWFTESGSPAKIGRITTTGTLTEYALPTATSSPWDITVGPDNKLWFTEHNNPGMVGSIDPGSHAIKEYALGAGLPNEIAAGPDGKLWLTLGASPGKIARIATDGTGYEEWAAPTANAGPLGLVRGPDGYMYFTEKTGNGGVGRVSMTGGIQEFPGGTTSGFSASSTPWGIATGSDGNLWFAESSSGMGVARLAIEPLASTGAASGVSDLGATVAGSVTPNSQATSAYFEYGTTTSYGSQTTAASVGSGASAVPLSAALGSLTPSTTYHYRMVATNPAGTRYGPDATFTTAAPAPADGSGTGPGGTGTGITGTGTGITGTGTGITGTGTTDTGVTSIGTGTGTDTGGGSGTTGTGGSFGGGPAPAPVIAEKVVVAPGDGSVLVKLPGSDMFVPLGGAGAVPVGSTIDTRRGTVNLTSVQDRSGKRQTGAFRGGIFEVRQQRSGMTDLYLRGGDFRSCGRGGRHRHGRVAAARATRMVRRLWGRDRHGRFRTRGSHAIATVRGTEWTVADRCDGTLTSVARGKVAVRDLEKKRTVLVRAGRSYLAEAKR